MAELKEVAKSIGVASEGEALTEAELKDARDYLNGVEEIVEAKKDEVCDGSCEKSEGEEPESDDDDEDDEGAEDNIDEATESYLDDLDTAIESSFIDFAMEGASTDAIAALKSAVSKMRTARKEMRAAAKSGDMKLAAEKAREGAGYADDLANACNNIPDSVSSAAIANIAVAVAVILGSLAVGGTKFGVHAKRQLAAAKTNVKNAIHKGYAQGKAAFDESVKAGAYGMDAGMSKAEMAAERARNAKAFAEGAKNDTIAAARKALAKTAKHDIGDAAAKGALITAAGATAGGGTALVKVLKSKNVVDAEGNVTEEGKKLKANDVNALISAIKLAAKTAKSYFEKKAQKFSSGENAEEASESTVNLFDGFIAACESYRFDSNSEKQDEVLPYLFG